MKQGERRGRVTIRVLAAAALAGMAAAIFWAGPRAGREAQGEGETAVFFGDSITEYCDLQTYYPGLRTVNEGIAGDTTGGMLERMDRVYAADPSVVVVLGGVNDLLSGYSAGQVTANLRSIVQNLHENLPKARIVVQSIYPIADSTDLYYTDIICAVNDALRSMAAELDYTYADVYAALQTADGRLDGRYSDDGLHPNDAGYRAACPVVRAAIDG